MACFDQIKNTSYNLLPTSVSQGLFRPLESVQVTGDSAGKATVDWIGFRYTFSTGVYFILPVSSEPLCATHIISYARSAQVSLLFALHRPLVLYSLLIAKIEVNYRRRYQESPKPMTIPSPILVQANVRSYA